MNTAAVDLLRRIETRLDEAVEAINLLVQSADKEKERTDLLEKKVDNLFQSNGMKVMMLKRLEGKTDRLTAAVGQLDEKMDVLLKLLEDEEDDYQTGEGWKYSADSGPSVETFTPKAEMDGHPDFS